MRLKASPQPRALAQTLQQLSTLGLRVGTVAAMAVAMSMLFTDLQSWNAQPSLCNWQLSSQQAKPGDWVIAKFHLPEAEALEDIAFSLDLPPSSGFRFIPGSLEVYQGSLEGATMEGFNGGTSLRLANLPRQTGSLQFEIGIQVPADMNWLGKALELRPALSVNQQPTHMAAHTLQIFAPSLNMKTRPVATDAGKVAFEIEVQNPADGIDFQQLGLPFEMEIDLEADQADIHLELVQVASDFAYGKIRQENQRILIPGLLLTAGQQLTVMLPLYLHQDGKAEEVKAMARVQSGEATLGKAGPVSGIEFPVTWERLKADVREDRAVLRWEVLSEQLNRGFVIEQSYNGGPFARIDFVPGSDDHTTRHQYQFTTEPLAPGRHVFRLQQQTHDGNLFPASQLELFAGCSQPVEVSVPDGEFAHVQVQRGQQVRILLQNAEGQDIEVLYQGFLQPVTTYDVYLHSTSLAPGQYQVVVSGAETSATAQFKVAG